MLANRKIDNFFLWQLCLFSTWILTTELRSLVAAPFLLSVLLYHYSFSGVEVQTNQHLASK